MNTCTYIETRITFYCFGFNVMYMFYLLENDQWAKVRTVVLLAKKCLVQFSRQKSILCCIDMKQMYLRCDKASKNNDKRAPFCECFDRKTSLLCVYNVNVISN